MESAPVFQPLSESMDGCFDDSFSSMDPQAVKACMNSANASAPPLPSFEVQQELARQVMQVSPRSLHASSYRRKMAEDASIAKETASMLLQERDNSQARDDRMQMLRREEVLSGCNLNLSSSTSAFTGGTFLAPNPAVSDSTRCAIFTTSVSGKKGWVSSKVDITNMTITISDDQDSSESGRACRNSKKKQRVYSMAKGGEAKLSNGDCEGRTNVLALKCVEGSKSKLLSFSEASELNRFHKVLCYCFGKSAAKMAELQAEKILTQQVSSLDQLVIPPHPSNRPDDDLHKHAKVCYSTNAKLSLFTKPSRCDSCGNGFSPDQVKPANISQLSGSLTVSDASNLHAVCFKCDELMSMRENMAKSMEKALDENDIKRAISIVRDSVVQAIDASNVLAPAVEVPLISSDYSNEAGLSPLLMAVTMPSISVAEEEMDSILDLGVDVNARACETIKKVVMNEGPTEDVYDHSLSVGKRRSKSSASTPPRRSKGGSGAAPPSRVAVTRSRRLSSVTINNRQITGVTPLMAATMMNRLGFIEKLISKGADPTIEGDAVTHLSPLSYAASSEGSAESLKMILKFAFSQEVAAAGGEEQQVWSRPNINYRNAFSLFSALHVSVDSNNMAATQLLLECGADRECVDANLETPLHKAAKNGSVAIVQLLLTSIDRRGDDENYVNLRDAQGNPAMISCVKSYYAGAISADECRGVVEELLSHSGSACVQNFSGECCLTIAERKNFEAKKGGEKADGSSVMSVVDKMGYAIKAERWDEVYTLVDNKNFHVEYLSNASGNLTALTAASMSPTANCENVTELLRRGASPILPCGEALDKHPINVAASLGQSEVLSLLLNGEISERQASVAGDVTPLSKAVVGVSEASPGSGKLSESLRRKRIDCVKMLLSQGSNPLQFDIDGETPFYKAVKGGDAKLVSCFTDYCKDHESVHGLFSLDAPHANGITALMECAKNGKNDLVELLLEGGASLTCKDQDGRTCLSYAIMAAQTSTLAFLLKKCSKGVIRAIDNFGCSLLHIAAESFRVNESSDGDAIVRIFSMLIDEGVDITLLEKTKGLSAMNIIRLAPTSSSSSLDKISKMLESVDTAMHEGHYETILKFIERGNCSVDKVCSTSGRASGLSPLMAACGKCSDEANSCVERLIELNADVNYQSDVLVAPFEGAGRSRATPLLSAVMAGNVVAGELLLRSGANLSNVPVAGEGGSCLLSAAVQARKNSLVERLIEAGAGINTLVSGVSPIFLVSANGDVDIMELLIRNGARIDGSFSAKASKLAMDACEKQVPEGFLIDGVSCLMMASLNGHMEAMKMLLNVAGESDQVTMTDRQGRTALHYAARGGYAGAVTLLLENSEISVNGTTWVDGRGRTPLMSACLSGSIGTVNCLLSCDSDPSATDGSGVSVLSEAMKSKSKAVTAAISDALLKLDRAIVTGKIDAFIDRVVKGAAPVNYNASNGNKGKITALVKACELKKPEWVQRLVELGADMNQACSGSAAENDSALLACARSNHSETMEALLKAGERNNGDARLRGNTNARNKDYVSPLSLAVSNDSGEMVALLLRHGANPLLSCSNMGLVDWGQSIESSETTTPFFLACASGKINSLKEMIRVMAGPSGGASSTMYNVDAQAGESKVTALMVASYSGHVDCAKELCFVGKCNVTLKDRLGRTAAHFATMQGHCDVLVVLCGTFGASVSDEILSLAADDQTRYTISMAKAGEEAYRMSVKSSIEEAAKKVRAAENRLESGQADLRRAQEVVAEIQEDNDRSGSSSRGATDRFKDLGGLLTLGSSLALESTEGLLELKKAMSDFEVRVEGELQRRLSKAIAATKCVICKVKERNTILLPCRHLACCLECTQHPRFRTCPLCLSRVESVSPDIGLHAPIATITEPRRIDAASGSGQAEGPGGESFSYAPVVVMRNSSDLNELTLAAGTSGRSLVGGNNQEEGIITAEATAVEPTRE